MKITSTTTYTVKYQVCHHTNTEGGMDYGEFGPLCDTIQEALLYLEIVTAHDKTADWEITLDVKKEVK